MTILRSCAELARQRGGCAYLVGGTVRDLLLGRGGGDLDVVIEGDALSLVRELARGSGGGVRTHAAFQTATLTLDEHLSIDFATARRERYRAPAALPEVEPGRLDEDLSRRDFTINAMALPLDEPGAPLVDPCDGAADVRRRRIHVLHQRSFIDDPTRGFRAARLAARLGFVITPTTRKWLDEARRDRVFQRLSGARVRRELELGFGEPSFPRGIRLLADLGLLREVDAELRLTDATRPALDRLGRSIVWYRELARDEPWQPWLAVLGLLMRAQSRAGRRRLLDRLVLTRAERKTLLATSDGVRGILASLSRVTRSRASRLQTICGLHSVETVLIATAAGNSPRLRSSLRRYLERIRGVRSDIGGADLLDAGMRPGPAIAAALAAGLAAKLDRPGLSRDGQLAAALRAARRLTSIGG